MQMQIALSNVCIYPGLCDLTTVRWLIPKSLAGSNTQNHQLLTQS